MNREIATKSVDDTQVELHVGRLPGRASDRMDLVNIADVGFGVSQVLPVLVALLTAAEDQLVYIEQPSCICIRVHNIDWLGFWRKPRDAAPDWWWKLTVRCCCFTFGH